MKGGALAVAAVLLAVVPAVAQTAVQARELTVNVDEVSLSDDLRVPTGEFRMTGGRFEPVFGAKKPAPGSIFLSAARSGDAVALRRALDAGANANAKTAGSGETALMLAAEQ